MKKWSTKSQARLDTCHPDLQLIANEVLQIHDCSIFEGYRDEETQNRYFNKGSSKVKFPNGKHNVLPSLAMDIAPYKKGEDPYDFENTLYFAGIVIGVANMLKDQGKISHKLKWGGNWSVDADRKFAFDRNGFYDAIHYQLE